MPSSSFIVYCKDTDYCENLLLFSTMLLEDYPLEIIIIIMEMTPVIGHLVRIMFSDFGIMKWPWKTTPTTRTKKLLCMREKGASLLQCYVFLPLPGQCCCCYHPEERTSKEKLCLSSHNILKPLGGGGGWC